MAQTTTQVTQSCGEVEFSTNCTDYTDISGATQSVSGTEQSRMVGDAYTLEGDYALVGAGKREPLDLSFVIVYTETDAEAYERVRHQFETAGCGATACVRWSPRGGDAGEEQITTAQGVLTSFTYPPLDAASGGVIMGGFTLHTPNVTTTIIAS